MKTYQSEQEFVTNFAKDAKSELKSNSKFEAAINGINVIVTAMDNNNASKVTIYTATINGVEFTGSITALKKRLNVTFKKEYARSAEGTKVTIKSDEELEATAKVAAKRIGDAFEILYKASQKYGLSRADMLERTESVEAVILETLIRQRDKVAKEREEREAKQATEAKRKAEAKRAELQRQLEALQKQLAEMQ